MAHKQEYLGETHILFIIDEKPVLLTERQALNMGFKLPPSKLRGVVTGYDKTTKTANIQEINDV